MVINIGGFFLLECRYKLVSVFNLLTCNTHMYYNSDILAE